MTTAVIVQNRSATRRLEALGMTGDEREVPSPLPPDSSVTYWFGSGNITGTADLLGEAESLKPGYEVGVIGHIALALSDKRLLGIVSSTEATGPAVWLAVNLEDLAITSSGTVGVFKKRPDRIEIRCSDWELRIGYVKSGDHASGPRKNGQELAFLSALGQ
jgi:hypothetical protein